jgi:hypothetical protein
MHSESAAIAAGGNTISSTVKPQRSTTASNAAAKALLCSRPRATKITTRHCAQLQAMGYTNKRGAPYSALCVKSMVEGAVVIHSARWWITNV